MYDRELLKAKAEEYCKRRNTFLVEELGRGTQGIVFQTGNLTAIKVHHLETGFQREVEIYERLTRRGISSVRGLAIPRFVDSSHPILTFEMSTVHVPCMLDFGGAYLDDAPLHLDRSESWNAEKAEEFGSNWAEAKAVLREIEYVAGIWMADVNTGNIRFSPASLDL